MWRVSTWILSLVVFGAVGVLGGACFVQGLDVCFDVERRESSQRGDKLVWLSWEQSSFVFTFHHDISLPH